MQMMKQMEKTMEHEIQGSLYKRLGFPAYNGACKVEALGNPISSLFNPRNHSLSIVRYIPDLKPSTDLGPSEVFKAC